MYADEPVSLLVYAMPSLTTLLRRPQPVLLDGAVGTELLRRGVRTELPLWSAHALLNADALQTLAQIHLDYARAGAEVLITNTFRTTARVLERAGLRSQWRELNQRAVQAARAAATAASGPCLVAGSVAPLEDCYRPDLVPPQRECQREHRRQVELLAELGVDLILIETMNCHREARAALEAACDTRLDVLLSLCPRAPAHLLSGEPLAETVPDLIAVGGDRLRGLLLNCAPPEVMAEVYPRLAALVSGLPHGLYVHLGRPEDTVGWEFSQRYEPKALASWMAPRLAEGARLVGGCCGTTPAHIAALRHLLDRNSR
jgi:S-methylmethionine-dependent homocysteine/selenocysteine methylase